MLAYLPLIQKLLVGYMTKKTHDGFSFNFQGLGLMALSAVLGFLTFLFLLMALQSYTADIYGVPVSWLITAASTCFLGLIAYLCAAQSKKKKAFIHQMKEDMQDQLTPFTQIMDELAEPIKDHPIAAVVLAALAGVLAGDKLNGQGTGD